MTRGQRRRADAGEDGAYAVLFAVLLMAFFGFAAYAMDVATHVEVRQDLHDTLDAAAHAGASLLPDDPVGAGQAALAYAVANDAAITTPTVDFWCIVGAENGAPRANQVGVTCEPGPFVAGDVTCDDARCYIPCDPALAGRRCNTIRVMDAKDVDYVFAPALGQAQGSTGTLQGAACRGNCGSDIEGPMDLVLVLDRTPSMRAVDLSALRTATQDLLRSLDPDRHHVALVAHGPSVPTPACPTQGVAQTNDTSVSSLLDPQMPLPGGSGWLAVGLAGGYHVPDQEPPVLTGPLALGVSCLANSAYGTNLGDPVLAAAQHLQAAGRDDVPGVVLFMTDGQPTLPWGTGSVSVADARDCTHARASADLAATLGDVAIVSVAYRLQDVDCADGSRATALLADMATDPEDGPATADDAGNGGCDEAWEIEAENDDGDFLYCAPDPSALAPVFAQLRMQLTDEVRLVRIPA